MTSQAAALEGCTGKAGLTPSFPVSCPPICSIHSGSHFYPKTTWSSKITEEIQKCPHSLTKGTHFPDMPKSKELQSFSLTSHQPIGEAPNRAQHLGWMVFGKCPQHSHWYRMNTAAKKTLFRQSSACIRLESCSVSRGSASWKGSKCHQIEHCHPPSLRGAARVLPAHFHVLCY